MGRNKRFGAGYTIQHAEEMFWQSLAKGEPDYKYVALAIGASPASPPSWAVWACIEARQGEESHTARGPDKLTPPILDEVVRFYARQQWAFEHEQDRQPRGSSHYIPLSFRSAVSHVAKDDPNWSSKVGGADSDWYKPIARAWDWEQKDCQAPASFWQLDGFKTTARIDRVMTQSVAAEVGDPDDLHVFAWIAKRMAERA